VAYVRPGPGAKVLGHRERVFQDELLAVTETIASAKIFRVFEIFVGQILKGHPLDYRDLAFRHFRHFKSPYHFPF
jgi:hypothetical protein